MDENNNQVSGKLFQQPSDWEQSRAAFLTSCTEISYWVHRSTPWLHIVIYIWPKPWWKWRFREDKSSKRNPSHFICEPFLWDWCVNKKDHHHPSTHAVS